MSDLVAEFSKHERRLADLCRRVADGVGESRQASDVQLSQILKEAAAVLSSGASLEEKQAATRNIRSQFHPDGLQDRWPSDMTAGTWSTLVYQLFDLSTIYVQLRYASVRS